MTTKKTAAADHASLVRMLRDEDFASLAARAYSLKAEVWGKRVALRGLVEVSNVCARNCLYCGIRRGNAKTARYRMDEDEILAAVAWAAENRYGSVVLQSGETDDEPSALFFERVLRRIRAELGDGIGITLSLGERHRDVYRRWLDAGANRYLLRIETGTCSGSRLPTRSCSRASTRRSSPGARVSNACARSGTSATSPAPG